MAEAAIRSTPVSADLPSPAVLMQGRHLCGNLPFLPSNLVPQFVPATFVCDQLQRRQAAACFQQGAHPDIRGSALIIGQHVRVFISGVWLPGAVQSVCSEPDSYIVRLTDGRVFRRTRRDINVDNSASAGFGVARPLALSRVLPTLTLPQQTPFFPTAVRLVAPLIPGVPTSTSATSLLPLSRPSTTSRAELTTDLQLPDQVIPSPPPAAVTPRPGSTRSGRPYLKPT